MKAVFSYYDWYYDKVNESQYQINLRYGGFYNEKMFFSSFILSVLQAKQFFDKVVLVCNEPGFNKLKFLELPFDEVYTDLQINEKEKSFYSSAKLKSFYYFNEPFCHLDYDLYFWNKIPDTIANKVDVLVDHVESLSLHLDLYKSLHYDFLHKGNVHLLPEIPNKPKNFTAINNGIVYVNNVPFIKKFANKVFNYINAFDNPNSIYHIVRVPYLEQFYLKHYAKANNVTLGSFTDLLGRDTFHKKPFSHLVGPSKCEYGNYMFVLNETRWRHYNFFKKIESMRE